MLLLKEIDSFTYSTGEVENKEKYLVIEEFLPNTFTDKLKVLETF